MAQVTWITPSDTLGTIAEDEYFEFQLDAYSTANPLTYTVIAGQLSDGLQLLPSGLIRGIPIVDITIPGFTFTHTFTVRCTNFTGQIADRTFSIIINAIALPQILPRNVTLGYYYPGHYLDLQLTAIDPNPLAPLVWTILDGEVPLGTTMSLSGRITGYIEPFFASTTQGLLGWSGAGWDDRSWDATTITEQSHTYYFTVQVFDGSRTDETIYSITTQAKSSFTIDNINILVDTTYITVDSDDTSLPFLITKSGALPTQRQLSNFAFQFIGRDLNGQTLNYAIYSGTLPTGLTLDAETGWLTGNIGSISPNIQQIFTFQVYCYEVATPSIASAPVAFTVTVLGDLNNIISWVTPSDLGFIDNGSVSEFSINAVSVLGKTLNYRFTPGEYSSLPQGLILLSNGLISGRTSFEYFSLDTGDTTFDNGVTSFDNVYSFTITASDASLVGELPIVPATVSAQKTFRISVNNFNTAPYENIYLRALVSKEQRIEFLNLLADTSIFPEQLIYRATDPWFGTSSEIKFLFAAGLAPSFITSYVEAMRHNHYTKSINLGNVKTAIALDNNFNVKYEVVYVEVVDPVTNNKESPAQSIDRTGQVSPPYNVPPFTVVYPNSLDNMSTDISTVGFTNRGALPDWMLDPQPGSGVLGFTRGVILAYTVPGASSLIAYRLRQNNTTFNDINFVVDRYELDEYLSRYYDIINQRFMTAEETTFDQDTTTFDGSTTKFTQVIVECTFDNGTTIFDLGATKFYSNRLIHALLDAGTTYLKFPQTNIYQ